MAAVKFGVEHQFDVDAAEFQSFWGVSVEHATKYNDSWTGQEGFHACTSRPCVDSVRQLFEGVRGRVCWCDCHSWNSPSEGGSVLRKGGPIPKPGGNK